MTRVSARASCVRGNAVRRVDTIRGADPPVLPPAATRLSVISSLTLADDFARQLTLDELTAAADAAIRARPVVIWSVTPDGIDEIRRDLGETRSGALARELTLFVRRNLRGSDVVTPVGDELLVLLDAPEGMAESVAQRLLAATRAHVFSGGATDRSIRLTLSIGAAAAPTHGASFIALASAARIARATVRKDALALTGSDYRGVLDAGRFVGRNEEVGRITDYLDDMVRGVGHVVAVIGEAGIGTSALVRSLEPEVRMRGGSLVVAACRENTMSAPYAIWRDVLRAVRRLPVKTARGWRELPSLDPTLERVVDDPPRGRSKMHLLEELADFLRLAAQQRALMLHLEEFQWADAASWDALEFLIPQLESERMLITLSFRSGESYDETMERWQRLVTRPRHHELRLARLTREEAKQWLEASLGTDQVGRDLLAYVYRQTEGNPLLLTHLLRDLEEGGHLTRSEGRWQWSAADLAPGHTSIDGLLTRRIVRLPMAARAVLESVAVLGRECNEELVARMTVLPATDVAEGLERLSAAVLLMPTFERVRGMHTFSHEEVGRVVRSLLEDQRRVALHYRAAQVLSELDGIPSTEIASHYDVAGARQQAHEYAVRAANEALALYENGAAASLLAAAERTAPSEASVADVRLRMASLADLGGRYEEAEALCNLSLAWYESQGDRRHALPVKRLRLRCQMMRGLAAQDTLVNLLALEQEAREENLDIERAPILLLISQTHFRLGDPVASQRVAEECVHIAERVGDAVLLVDSCNRLALSVQLHDAPRARMLFERARAIATEIGDTLRRVRLLNNLGVLGLLENDWGAARAHLTAAAGEARTAGLTELWGRAELNLGVLHARVGDYAAAAHHLGEALQLCATVQHSELQLYATYNLAHLERERGNIRRAGDTYELVTALARRIGQAEVEHGARAGFGLCGLKTGNPDAAHAALGEVEPFLRNRADWFQGRELAEALVVKLTLLAGRSHEAVERARRALALADTTDIYGAALLTSELADDLRPHAPAMVQEAVDRYSDRPEVLVNPKIKELLAVLKVDSKSTIDRS